MIKQISLFVHDTLTRASKCLMVQWLNSRLSSRDREAIYTPALPRKLEKDTLLISTCLSVWFCDNLFGLFWLQCSNLVRQTSLRIGLNIISHTHARTPPSSIKFINKTSSFLKSVWLMVLNPTGHNTHLHVPEDLLAKAQERLFIKWTHQAQCRKKWSVSN